MQTSLQAIAQKAIQLKQYRFRDLYRMIDERALYEAWREINKQAAPGIDKVTAQEFAKNLDQNIRETVERLKKKSYRAKLVRRKDISKGEGKTRPLGIPVVADKLVQRAAAKILEAVYEQDFLKCSYGYRPNVGPRTAVEDITKELQDGIYNYIVEADIKGFFDNIDHEWLLKMLEQRVDDKAFIGLIRKWLKAGVLNTDGQVIHPVTGTPQGGIISPVLANIYLHYAVDLWFDKVVKPNSEGEAYICRYADDFICAFRYKRDAQRFYQTLGKRLGKFCLTLAVEKTNITNFSRLSKVDRTSFEFLGFEFRWGVSLRGARCVKKRTSRKKLRKSLENFKNWCQENRNLRLKELFQMINAKLRGYYNYYGVIGNYYSLNEFYMKAKRILFRCLNRRSQRKSYNWEQFKTVLRWYGMLTPRITEQREKQLKMEFA